MIGRVVEIANDGRFLSTLRGFLVVSEGKAEVGRVALDDIAAIVVNAHGCTYTNNLMVTLTRRNIPLVLCGSNHAPEAILWPVQGHHAQSARMAAQLEAGKPLKKRIWQQIVRAKIRQQGASLEAAGKEAQGFYLLERKVRSGDPENVEAQAARRYWPLLFGPKFRRDKTGSGLNGMLNYGYTIVRSGVARAVMAAGLHPGLGLHHSNRGNPMCLVDDLMEPFRPLVDRRVWQHVQTGADELDRSLKVDLAELLVSDMATASGTTPALTVMERLATSLARIYTGEADELALPLPPLPLVR